MDPFLSTIGSLIAAEGYTVKLATEPNHRVWDTLPAVLVSPAKKSLIGWLAFGFRNVVSDYEVVLIQANNLDTEPAALPTDVPTFQGHIIDLFHQISTSMRAAGAWNCTVENGGDYLRALLPKGYTYTSMTIHVAWIENNA